jgi:hypothetical protein
LELETAGTNESHCGTGKSEEVGW